MISWLRIAGAVIAVAALAALAWRVSLSFTQGSEIEAQAAQITSLEVAAARDTRIARELSDFRASQADHSEKFREEVASKPITHEVAPHVDKVTGTQVACTERDPRRYRELFNQAVTGTASVP